jgi:hypothetical protein
MAVFISYSHQNADFVDQLALRLSAERVHVWLDRWELRVGDSLTQRVEAALERASAILVVLSKASVQSDWCRRELNAGLVRELELKRVVVLPLVIEDCDIPLFLRDKLWADFRTDFAKGFAAVLAALAPVTSLQRGRLEQPEFVTDYAIDYFEGKYFYRRLTLVDHAPTLPYIAITEVEIEGNEAATAFHQDFVDAAVGWWSDRLVIEALAETLPHDLQVVLEDQMPKSMPFAFEDKRHGAHYNVKITSRLLGTDTGNSVLLHVGNQLRQILDDQRRATRQLTADELRTIAQLRSKRGA